MDRKYIQGVRAALDQMAQTDEAVKYPHMMYDPKTGKEVTAKTPEDHEKFAKMGYTHEKPKMDEALDDKDKGTIMKVAKKLKKASAAHDKQSKQIMKDLEDDASNDKSDDGEGMDKVDPKAAAKKFKDRKDKDIDNDGDVDSSDEYLHKRRKAIGKTMKKESTVRERLTSIWEDAAGAKRMKDQNRENMPKDDARSDKKMMDGHPMAKHGKGQKEDPESKKAEDSTKPAAMRNNDNKQGDKNIMPSATKDHPAHKTTKEQFDAIAKAWEEVKNGD